LHEKNRDRFPWAALGGGGNQGMQKAVADMQRKMADLNGVALLQVVKVKSGGNEAQAAQMQQGMAQARALARMGGTSSGSGALFEMTRSWTKNEPVSSHSRTIYREE
jgi:hypothetical protein